MYKNGLYYIVERIMACASKRKKGEGTTVTVVIPGGGGRSIMKNSVNNGFC